MKKPQTAAPGDSRAKTIRSAFFLIVFIVFCVAYVWYVYPMFFGKGEATPAKPAAVEAARPADANYGTDGEPVSAMP